MSNKTRGKRRRGLIAAWTIVALILAAGLGGTLAYFFTPAGDYVNEIMGWENNDYEGTGHGETVIVITEGEIGGDIAVTLAEADVVKTSEVFYELLLGQDPQVEFVPGSYRVRLQMSAQAALDALQNPENRLNFTAVVPEGKTVEQTLELVSASADIPLEELQQAAADPGAFGIEGLDSLEGWLFPATYEFEGETTGAQAIQTMVDAQVSVLNEFGVADDDRQRVLTIAAMVQREGGRVEDFGRISRVIYNRLATGMLLQMDSTAQYGYGQHEDGSVWSSDDALSDDNPWNTYVHTGLPQGPIANPGRDAISAAVDPEPGDWIYFAAVNLDTGESVFSVTMEEHEAAVQQLRDWCEANPGRGC